MNGLQSLRQITAFLPRAYAPTLLSTRRAFADGPLIQPGDKINPNVPAHGTRTQNFVDDGKDGVQGTLSRAVNAVTDTAHKVAESIKEATGFKSTVPGEEAPAERELKKTHESVQESADRLKEGVRQGIDNVKDEASQTRDAAERNASHISNRAREGAAQTREGASKVGDKAREGADQVGEKVQQGWEKTKDVAQDLKESAQIRAEQAKQSAKGAWEKAKEAVGNLEPESQQQRAEEARQRTASVGTTTADRSSPPYGRPGVGPADNSGR